MSEKHVSEIRPAVVIHVPHAATVIPTEVRSQFALSDAELDAELRRMTDHLTDELFAMPGEIATTITFPVSRLVIDPERFELDD
jgi:N-formylglutamate deformylase